MTATFSSSLPLILISVLLGVGGQLTLKIGMTQVGRIGVDALGEPFEVLTRVLLTPMVVGGLALYVLGAGVWLAVLSRVPLSLAYPVLALSYVVTPIVAWLVLGETVPAVRWIGLATICLGVVIVSRT
jgi:drug/metabolite transporter (DMT)-like permease